MSLIEEALRRQERDGTPPSPPAARLLDPPPAAAPPPRRRSRPAAPSGRPFPSPPPASRSRSSLPGAAVAAGVTLLLLATLLPVVRRELRRLPSPAESVSAVAPPPAAVAGLSPAEPPAAAAAAAGAIVSPSPAEIVSPSPAESLSAVTAAVPATASPPAEPPPWPHFVLKGFVVGTRSLAVLDDGEMLEEGETSHTGVRLLRVTPQGAWFQWRDRTKLLRKGESADKPWFEGTPLPWEAEDAGEGRGPPAR